MYLASGGHPCFATSLTHGLAHGFWQSCRYHLTKGNSPTISGQGGINQLSSSTYSKGWSQIVDSPGPPSNMPDTGNPDRLLFYNSGSGLAQIYNTDNKGGISQLSNNNV